MTVQFYPRDRLIGQTVQDQDDSWWITATYQRDKNGRKFCPKCEPDQESNP